MEFKRRLSRQRGIKKVLFENKKASTELAHYGLFQFVGKSNLPIF